MARFDVFRGNRNSLLVDVRADQLESLGTYILIPLVPIQLAPKPIKGLNPILDFDGMRHVLMTQLIAAAPRKEFTQKVGNVAADRDDIIRALDIRLTGF